ncbi:MAG TPA: hypothetical protein VGR74_20415, partial [Actinomycetota bacterium]|nr:hypothetical protein [Actinomycetota bacterium]
MPRPSIETARGWREKTMVDREGVPLGRIVHVYLDQVTEEPEWALVATGQGGRQVFVPLVDAAEQQDQVRVHVERTLVSDAPAIRAGRQLSKEASARLHGHYGGAPELRWGSARRMPGGGPSARLRQGLDWARERVPSRAAVGSPRTRLLAAVAAASSVAGGLLLVRRRRLQRSSGLAAAIGRAVGSGLAVPAGALRRRRRRRRLRALGGTAAAPFAAAGRAVARAGRGVPAPTRRSQPRTLRSRR